MPPALVATFPPSEPLCSPGRHGVDEAQRGQLAVELLERHARLHHGDLVLGVDLENPLHAVEGEQDAVGDGNGGAGEPGAAAPGHHRDAVLAGQLQDLGHLAGRPRQDERPAARPARS